MPQVTVDSNDLAWLARNARDFSRQMAELRARVESRSAHRWRPPQVAAGATRYERWTYLDFTTDDADLYWQVAAPSGSLETGESNNVGDQMWRSELTLQGGGVRCLAAQRDFGCIEYFQSKFTIITSSALNDGDRVVYRAGATLDTILPPVTYYGISANVNGNGGGVEAYFEFRSLASNNNIDGYFSQVRQIDAATDQLHSMEAVVYSDFFNIDRVEYSEAYSIFYEVDLSANNGNWLGIVTPGP